MRPEVTTAKGTYVGAQLENGTIAFKGIPFAQPPVGKLRWQAPQPLADSTAHFDAGTYRPAAIQSPEDDKFGMLPQSEDCLYLNIFAADLNKTAKPVLVWVHGGSYIKGGASHPDFYGDLLVTENPDILMVSVSYRLGVLGSLNLSKLDPDGEYRFSNNLARLDLQAALQWIHENIAAFGGDPANVTLWGHSAGSSNISAQLMMEGARPYFQKAIMHSSFAVDVGTTSWENSLGAADVFFGYLGNPTLDQLLDMPVEKIFEAQVKLQRSDYFDSERKPFSVVLDDIVIPKDSFARLCAGSAKGIDVITGTACGEYDQQFRPLDMEKKYAFLKSQLGKKTGDLDALIAFYQAQAPETPLDEIYMDIKNDLWLRIPGNLIAQAMQKGGSRAWMYYTLLRKPDGVRAHHGNECAAVFCREDNELVTADTAKKMRQSFLAFVRCGKPEYPGLDCWPEYDGTTRTTLCFAEDAHLVQGIRLPQMEKLLPLFAENKYL